VACNLICPGLVETEALKAFHSREERLEAAEQSTPTSRLTRVEDIAEAARFLSGEGASQIIGQTLVIDGGRSLLA
jgi:enoyl-[acyl-carrier protein] reductase III